MTLKANGKGVLRKTFFSGQSVKIGDPIAIIVQTAKTFLNGKELALVEVIERKRRKPSEKDHSSIEIGRHR